MLFLYPTFSVAQSNTVDLTKVDCSAVQDLPFEKGLCKKFQDSLKSAVDRFVVTIDGDNGLFFSVGAPLNIGYEKVASCKYIKPDYASASFYYNTSQSFRLDVTSINEPIIWAGDHPLSLDLSIRAKERQRTKVGGNCIDPTSTDHYDLIAKADVVGSSYVSISMNPKISLIDSYRARISIDPTIFVDYTLPTPPDIEFDVRGRDHGMFAVHQIFNTWGSFPAAIYHSAAAISFEAMRHLGNSRNPYYTEMRDSIPWREAWTDFGTHTGEAYLGTMREFFKRTIDLDIYDIAEIVFANEAEKIAYRKFDEKRPDWINETVDAFYETFPKTSYTIDLRDISSDFLFPQLVKDGYSPQAILEEDKVRISKNFISNSFNPVKRHVALEEAKKETSLALGKIIVPSVIIPSVLL